MRTLAVAASLILLMLAGCASPDPAGPLPASDAPVTDGRGDVTVVAIIDSGFDPYHWDFLASQMPQALNDDPSDDLPLGQDPSTWLPGYPAPATFASYDALTLTLAQDDGKAVPAELHEKDAKAWEGVKPSSPTGDIHMRWVPGTKVVGFVDFAGDSGFAADSHGVGTTSVSVGNLHGTCPSCVFVFVNGLSDEAVTWVAQQPWIDAQSNSWGFSKVATDKIWTDCDLPTQRAGVERGQQIFFSGGNGMANAFDAPSPTVYSCQKGADWVVTVGANTPDGNTYTGAGKPADLANVGSSYPSQGGSTVKGESTFSGTSNATPVTMGLYAQSLYDLRRRLDGPSRMQDNGTIAQGPAGCGPANLDCALADGALTVHELRNALYDASSLVGAGFATGSEAASVPASNKEYALMGEGHGSFFGHVQRADAEVARIVGLASGDVADTRDPQAVAEIDAFAVAVSYCMQMVWGSWEHGAWGDDVALPDPDPEWPVRTWFTTECPQLLDSALTTIDALPL